MFPLTVHFVDGFLAVYFSSVALFYTARVLLLRRRNPSVQLINHGQAFQRQWFSHSAFRVFRVLIWGVCVARLWLPVIDDWIVLFPMALSWRLMGVLLLCIGFGIALLGHRTLGEQWRSGVDANQRTRLVTHGLYAYSRNPMFIGVRVALLGFALALPSLLGVMSLVVGWLMLALQTKVEEQHLATLHGGIYQRYTSTVGRWI